MRKSSSFLSKSGVNFISRESNFQYSTLMIEYKQANNSYCHDKPVYFRACAIITCNIRISFSILNFRSTADLVEVFFDISNDQLIAPRSVVDLIVETCKDGVVLTSQVTIRNNGFRSF